MPDASHLPVGIDLGTTYSVVAYIDTNGRPTTVLNGSGDLLTPSAVAFEAGEVVVGKEAVKGSVIEPDTFADCFKRDMGRHKFRRVVNGHEVPPEVLNAFLLERLKRDAERRLGEIRRVVITVPAFFDETRRKATQEAGRLAGLDVMDIINEPTAAAVAFGYHRATVSGEASADRTERVLVYDLGGGTFDVTILEIDGRTFRTLATDGDVQLGGKDFDERLVNHLAERFRETHGADPRSDSRDAAQLWLDAQEAKHALSERQKTTVVVFHAGVRLRAEITRGQFEELTRDLLERTQTTTALVLKQAELTWDKIDRVLLVGGSTRMPMVAGMLRELSGREPDQSQSADEVVAHGAALYAAMLSEQPAADRPKFELVNVNSHSLGVVGTDPETGQKINVVLIKKNTPLPCRKKKLFRTAHDNQQSVKVSVIEGENQRPEYCIALGSCVVRDLPPGLPAGSPVEVEYRYAANGTLTVWARVSSARQSAFVEIQRDRQRELGDLDTWRRRLSVAGSSSSGMLPIPVARSAAPAVPPRATPVSGLSTAPVPPPLPRAMPVSAAANRTDLLPLIDECLARLGEQLASRPLPPPLETSRQALFAAGEELRRAMAAVQQLQAMPAGAASASEAIQRNARLTQALHDQQQAATCRRFALLGLARACLQAGLIPPELQHEAARIAQLQAQMAGG